jgi:hypothetical protein
LIDNSGKHFFHGMDSKFKPIGDRELLFRDLARQKTFHRKGAENAKG